MKFDVKVDLIRPITCINCGYLITDCRMGTCCLSTWYFQVDTVRPYQCRSTISRTCPVLTTNFVFFFIQFFLRSPLESLEREKAPGGNKKALKNCFVGLTVWEHTKKFRSAIRFLILMKTSRESADLMLNERCFQFSSSLIRETLS